MVSRRIALLALAVVAAGCGGSRAHTVAPAPFAYDRSAPLGFHDNGQVNHGYPIQVRDVSYTSPRGGRVPAFLVLPPGKGPFPAVVYLHGSGEDRTRLLVPAAWLAAREAVGLTIDSALARSTRPVPRDPLRELELERDLTVQTVVDLRRAVDVLDSLPQVDPKRIGFVGFSSGAKIGALLAGAEHRIRAFDLMSGGSLSPSAFAAAAPRAIRARVRHTLEHIDPLRALPHAAPSALFFQDGLRDEFVPRKQLLAFEQAGSRPKRVRWYEAGHSLDDQAFRDQLRWLSSELGVRGPVVPGARTGP